MHHKTKSKLNFLTNYIQSRLNYWERKYPNFLGAYSGLKYTNNHPGRHYAIVFLVSEKKSGINKPFPKYIIINIPGIGKKRIPTDVVEVMKFELFSINLGCKIESTKTLDFGTIGVFLKKDNHVYACTNAHVIMRDKLNSGIFYFFNPISNQTISDVNLFSSNGHITRAFLQEGIFSGLDAVICRISNSQDIDNLISNIGIPSGIKKIQKDDIGYNVSMKGYVSGLLSGKVTRVGVSILSPYTKIYLHNLIEVELFCKHGDSGSPVFNNALKIIGIVLGGNNKLTYVIPIDNILEYFSCHLLN